MFVGGSFPPQWEVYHYWIQRPHMSAVGYSEWTVCETFDWQQGVCVCVGGGGGWEEEDR